MNLFQILNPDTSLQPNNHHCQYNNYDNVITRVLSQPFLLDYIISFIEPFDISTLHSISLVNRLWCRTAVPFLWSSPFSQKINIDNLLDIISVYVSCLDESSQRSLILLQLRIENRYIENSCVDLHTCENRSSRIDPQIDRDIRTLRLPLKPSPIFDYPRFMRSLDVYSLYKVTCEWLRTTVIIMDLEGNPAGGDEVNTIKGDHKDEINTIEINTASIQSDLETSREMTEDYYHYFIRELFKLFMTRATHLTHLKIDFFPECCLPYMILFYSCTLQPSPNCIAALSHITTLDLNVFNISPYFLLEFSTHCTKISSLFIRSCCFSESACDLSQLIKSQQSLRHLRLEEITVTPKLISSLCFHTTTLESLILTNVKIENSRALWSLSSFSRLKTLTIHFLSHTYGSLRPLWNFYFPDIRKFKLTGKLCGNSRKSFVDNTCSFLELNGRSLRILDLDLDLNAYSRILLTIGERCKELRKLTIRGYKQHDTSLARMLKDTSIELEKLKVIHHSYDYCKSRNDRSSDACKFPPLKELRGAKWLKHLDLCMSLDVYSVERLLDNWEAPLVRFGYYYNHEYEVDAHHEVLRKFAHRLDEGLKRRHERRRLNKINLVETTFEWFQITTRKMEMYIEYVDD